MTPEVSTVLQMSRLWPQTIGSPTKVSSGRDLKSSSPVGHSNRKKTFAMVARSHEDGEETFTCKYLKRPISSGNSKKTNLNRLTSDDEAIYSAACHARSNDSHITYRNDCG